MKLYLNDLRCAFEQIYTPGVFPGAAADAVPAHSLTLIVPPKHAAVKILDDAFLKLATDDKKWGNGDEAKARKIIEACLKDRKKSSWQKEAYANDDGSVYDGFEDAFYARLRNETPPKIVDQLRRDVGKGAAGAPYGGCDVNVVADAWLQTNSFGKGLRLKLLGVQFVRVGDAFTGGAKATEDDFQDLSVDSEDADDDFA